MELGWYCPSEGDGRRLGTRAPELAPTIDHLASVALAAERAGATEILIPTGTVNDSFAPDAPFMESWTTAAALAVLTRRIRLLVAVNPAALLPGLVAHQVRTLAAIAPGRVAVNLVAGGGPDTGYGAPPLDHDARYARLGELADTLRGAFDGPLYLGGASPAALDLAARVADTYLMWGEPPDAIAARIADMRARAGRPMRFGLRIHLISRDTEREARAAAARLVERAEVRDARAGEYAAFDSVGQARMNEIDADGDGWVAPGLWAGIRSVRGGAGTALVGAHAQVAALLRAYRAAGVDLVIGSGYPHREEAERVATRVWPLLRDRAAA
ncbi:LLM class flavin-dependent oxidoreductase [Miltoncostaea oceani]|jgi:alkanesulfonate monooxygenase|uniref:LLM class flavin-dependent oxidoreductase n=1 Tax=Miltoncostaea oceani TaxID=2843216 RepID=UPI001FEB775E|nr:LLM class flavin-dependent oxidoreductase [Miltoncostaea oceani]